MVTALISFRLGSQALVAIETSVTTNGLAETNSTLSVSTMMCPEWTLLPCSSTVSTVLYQLLCLIQIETPGSVDFTKGFLYPLSPSVGFHVHQVLITLHAYGSRFEPYSQLHLVNDPPPPKPFFDFHIFLFSQKKEKKKLHCCRKSDEFISHSELLHGPKNKW